MITVNIKYICTTHSLSRTLAHLRELTHAHTQENSRYIYVYIYIFIATVFTNTPCMYIYEGICSYIYLYK
jgi:hypothetical protein